MAPPPTGSSGRGRRTTSVRLATMERRQRFSISTQSALMNTAQVLALFCGVLMLKNDPVLCLSLFVGVLVLVVWGHHRLRCPQCSWRAMRRKVTADALRLKQLPLHSSGRRTDNLDSRPPCEVISRRYRRPRPVITDPRPELAGILIFRHQAA